MSINKPFIAAPSSTDPWKIGSVVLQSRFMLGTARYPSSEALALALDASGAEVITVGVRRELSPSGSSVDPCIDVIRDRVRRGLVRLLPNTAGCNSAGQAVLLAHMARELYDTSWIKLEVVADARTLEPDSEETVLAAAELVKDGYTVLPYCTTDLATGQRLLDVGCSALMPWAAPIGSGLGLVDVSALRAFRAAFPASTLVVDAGIGAPSHAALAMEAGFDAVLLNSAVAGSKRPGDMARAFSLGIDAGRRAFHAGLITPRSGA